MFKPIKATTSNYEPLSMNLQLFADDGDDANESQTGAVDSSDDNAFDDGNDDYFDFAGTDDSTESKPNIKEPKAKDVESEGFDDIGSNDEDIAEPQSKMTPEENKAFQKIRQKALASVEKDRQAVAEQMKYIQQQNELMQANEVKQKHLAAITDERIEALAYEKGYSVESAREILHKDAQIAATYEINQRQKDAEINRLKKDQLRNDRYFKHVEPQLDSLLKQDPSIDLNGAYNYLLGEYLRSGKMDDLIQQERKSTQQRTVADIQDRNKRRSMSGGDSGSSTMNASNNLSREDTKIADAWGIDKKELAEYKRQQDTNNRKRR